MEKIFNIHLKEKIQIICIAFVLVILSTSNVFAYTNLKNYKPTYGSLSANVNFRFSASTKSGKIRVLKKGTGVKMLATIDNFYIVELGSNEVGIVSKDYVKSANSAPKGAKVYTAVTIKNGTTNASNVILRGGPSTSFRKVTKFTNKTKVKIIGYIDNFYVVVTDNNLVGCIRKDLITLSSTSQSGTTNTNNTSSFKMSENEKIIFDLINSERKKAGLNTLSADSTLFKVARLKAQDMVKNSYFSHNSPTYGSPFEMMKKYGISYKVAGENIAGNPDLKAAVHAWMNSDTHKQNILSTSYNYIGIGIEKSDTYGYVISTMFIR